MTCKRWNEIIRSSIYFKKDHTLHLNNCLLDDNYPPASDLLKVNFEFRSLTVYENAFFSNNCQLLLTKLRQTITELNLIRVTYLGILNWARPLIDQLYNIKVLHVENQKTLCSLYIQTAFSTTYGNIEELTLNALIPDDHRPLQKVLAKMPKLERINIRIIHAPFSREIFNVLSRNASKIKRFEINLQMWRQHSNAIQLLVDLMNNPELKLDYISLTLHPRYFALADRIFLKQTALEDVELSAKNHVYSNVSISRVKKYSIEFRGHSPTFESLRKFRSLTELKVKISANPRKCFFVHDIISYKNLKTISIDLRDPKPCLRCVNFFVKSHPQLENFEISMINLTIELFHILVNNFCKLKKLSLICTTIGPVFYDYISRAITIDTLEKFEMDGIGMVSCILFLVFFFENNKKIYCGKFF